jgi:hypothetical protein
VSANAGNKSTAAFDDVEGALGLPLGFLQRQVTLPDQWSFFTQAYSVMETMMAECLAESVGPELRECFARLTLPQKRRFLAARKLLDAKADKAVDAIAVTRNHFAHDPRRIGMTLDQYVVNQPNEYATLMGSCRTYLLSIDLPAVVLDNYPIPPRVVIASAWVSLVVALNKHRKVAQTQRITNGIVEAVRVAAAGQVVGPYGSPSPFKKLT